ncbi:MAG: hypothetical protein O2807_10575 [bacterium]|nr:hypothetical protein [bacterium]
MNLTTATGTMQFRMDEKRYDIPAGVATFGELCEWVMNHFKELGRVLLGVMDGDVTLMQGEMAEWAGRPIGEFENIECLSADPKALMRRTCEDSLEFLVKLSEWSDKTVSFFKANDEEGAQMGVMGCAEGWSLILNSYWNLLQMAGLDNASAEVGGKSLAAVSADFGRLLKKLHNEFERNNAERIREILMIDFMSYQQPFRDAFEKIQLQID